MRPQADHLSFKKAETLRGLRLCFLSYTAGAIDVAVRQPATAMMNWIRACKKPLMLNLILDIVDYGLRIKVFLWSLRSKWYLIMLVVAF